MVRHKLEPLMRKFHHAIPSENLPILPKHKVQNYSHCLHLVSSCENLSCLFQIHATIIVSGLHTDHQANTHLIKSYLLFQKCNFAHFIFDSLQNPSVKLYNLMVRAYVRAKNYQEVVRMYHDVLSKGLEPDKYTFNFVLKACSGALAFKEGMLVHKEVILRGLECDAFIGTSLTDMYCKMGDLVLARKVFDKMPNKDVVAWNAMILGLSKSVDPDEALRFVRSMQLGGIEPNLVSILNLIPAVSRLGDVNACRSIHGYVIRRGFNEVVSDGLIDMYAKCGKIDEACCIFGNMENKDGVSWGTMMAGCAHNGCFLQVLELFDCMKRENMRLNKVSVVCALIAAAEMRDLGRGRKIHDSAIELGIDSTVTVATPIMTMYAKCGNLESAKQLFQELSVRDLVAWSAIIAAFGQSGYPEEALSLFREMQNGCLEANNVTLLSVIPACAELPSLRLGKSMHCYAVKREIDLDLSTGTALVSMYAKCGFFSSALTMFSKMPYKDVATWNVLINGYTQAGEPYHAITMYHKLHLSETRPDSRTVVGLLPACALLYDLEQGSCIHGEIVKCGFESDSHVNNALIDMYSKCGFLTSAEILFNKIDLLRDEVSWNVIISGYMHNGHDKEAISAFFQMKLENCRPNVVTIVSVLPAAAHQSCLREGMTLHAFTIQMGFLSNVLVGNSLVDMYAKCGQLGYSENVFHEMKNRDTVSWNVMIAGYGVHGQGRQAIEVFSLMQQNNVRVDSMSFLNVLTACRHSGLIEEGKDVFDSMRQKHQLEPDLEHYACMVDLLGRSGLFDEMLDLIKAMPMEPDAGVWGALLGACTLHYNVPLAEFALDHLVKLEPKNPIHFVALSGTYANAERWDDASNTRSKMIRDGLMKKPGCSWVCEV